ncbi:MAG: DEAD/DEAH box helicase [Myxococcales bacterium]|nr:DEAD/DEAH box helicase [Myxococcota bacterium]MDW8282955.1 DEAD/DEAH box helicase [Myxococcales bacterium]
MQIHHLSAYDVSPDTITALREAVGEELLPLQERAVREGLLGTPGSGPGESLILAAPPSAGKSLLGELAAVHAAARGRRALYLVPLKAMAEELYRSLQNRYAALDLRVVISTRDRREFDGAIERGEFHIAVLVFEKLYSLLVSRPELLAQVGLVVIDELHLLLDPERGPKLELLLTKLQRARQQGAAPGEAATGPLQLCCLSAPLLGLQEVGAWLGARVVVDNRRPVELRTGVLYRGTFTYVSSRSDASAEGGGGQEEIYPWSDAEGPRDVARQVVRAVEALVRRGEQTLVFVPDRARSVECARQISAQLGDALPPAAWTMDEIEGTDEGQARSALLETLGRSVAFHNADLTQAQREIVERAFRRGEVRVLCATRTLSMGVNLPVQNVLLTERWQWRYSRRYSKWVRDELTKVEFDAMAGRAGRLGSGAGAPGRAMLVAPSRFDAEVWLRNLVGGPPQEVEPALLGRPLGDVVLDVVASSLCRDEAEVIDLLLSTLTGHLRWAHLPSRQPLVREVGQTIEDLVLNGLVCRNEHGGLEATTVGRTAARKGLTARSAVLMARWADAAVLPEVPLTALEVLLVCALTPDGGEAHVPLSLPEHRFGDYWTRILLRAQALGIAERRLFRWLRDQRGRLSYDQTRSVKKALLLLDWIEGQSNQEIERNHNVWAGAVAQAGAEFAWLVDALAEVCDARGWPSSRTEVLLRLRERLRYGVTEDLLGLAQSAGEWLPRSHLLRARAQGACTAQEPPHPDWHPWKRPSGRGELLEQIHRIQAARAAARACGLEPQPQVRTAVSPAVPEPSGQPPPTEAETSAAAERLPALRPVVVRRREEASEPAELVLLPDSAPRRCFIQMGPQRVGLSPGSFALLARLALGAATGAGWVPKEALGRSAGAVRKSISRLRAELRRIDTDARSWIENDGRGCYRLSLSAPRLVLDRDALRQHPLPSIRAALRAA